MFNLFEEIGRYSLDVFWIPVALWTVLAVAVLLALNFYRRAQSIYKYHTRMALLTALPAGILLSGITRWLDSTGTEGTVTSAKWIVIHAPISITAAPASSYAGMWTNPTALLGAVTLACFIITLCYIIKIVIDFVSLRSFSQRLSIKPLPSQPEFSNSNKAFAAELLRPVFTAYSNKIEVPFTYGMFRPVIVLPQELKKSGSLKVDMVLRHELMHIRHLDYLLNGIAIFIKALFWFHPLVPLLNRQMKQYREISCDQEVLVDSSISRKSYAQLLVELSPKKSFKNIRPVSMAVDPSTLKKRIAHMTTSTIKSSLFRSSFALMIFSVLIMAGFIACSDIQDSGITNQDVEQAQAQMLANSTEGRPLYIVNGAIMDTDENRDLLSRIKTKYIENIRVTKGEKAIEEYGEQGRNGVIEMTLIDEEKAFEDLKDPSAPPQPEDAELPSEPFFVVVEQMPKLKGGMQKLQECVNYPQEAKEQGIEGRVIVQFIVTESGQVEDANIIRGIGGGADEEALRCVQQAEFEPGRQRGQAVRVQYSLPIIFRLSNNGSVQENKPSAYMESYKVEGKKIEIKNLTLTGDGMITGTVLDGESNRPLAGANVVLTSNDKGAATDNNGKFTLAGVNQVNPEIRISFVGYDPIVAKLK